jgi:dihydrofolate reductase
MSRIRCGMAMSLDGYIAGPEGEYDWIVTDPEFDFAAIWAQYDTLLMGRRTYEVATARLGKKALMGKRGVVVSRTMREANHPGITIVSDLTRGRVEAIRAESRKDIWLFGGGEVFRALLDLGEVDRVELSVIPVLLGGGVPLLATPAKKTGLKLLEQKVYGSGIVSLTYEVER